MDNQSDEIIVNEVAVEQEESAAEETVAAPEETVAAPEQTEVPVEQAEAPAEQPRKKNILAGGIITTAIISFLMILVGQLLGSLLVEVPVGIVYGITHPEEAMAAAVAAQNGEAVSLNIGPALETGMMYLIFIGIWIVAMLVIAIPKSNRYILGTLWTKSKGNTGLSILLGLLIGGGLNALCIVVAWLNKDIALSFDSFRIVPLILVFIAVLIQSSAEELICRGFMYQRILKKYNKPWLAIVINSSFFGALHLMNDGVTVLSIINIVVFGVLASLIIYYFDSMWCVMFVHTAWNYTQNIIFGLPNSGMVTPFSILKLDAANARNSFAYNTGFGVEGTILADAVLIITCVVIYLIGRSRKNQAA